MTADDTEYAVAYARVSTDDHDQNPESQLVAIRDYCKTANITILKEFSDKSTGTSDERDGLDAIFGFKRHHPELTWMIVLCPDRLSRNVMDAPAIIKDLKSIGVLVKYVSDPTLRPESAQGSVIQAFNTFGAQYYTDEHKLKIKAGLDRARANGTHIGRPLTREDNIDVNVVMGLAQKGYSFRKMEKIFKCSRTTLMRRCKDAGIYEECLKMIESSKTQTNL